MRMKSTVLGPLVSAVLLASGAASHAALTTYSALAGFAAATNTPGVDGYDGFSTTGLTNSPLFRSAGVYSYRATTFSTDPLGPSDFFGAGTAADPWLSTNFATDSIVFDAFSPGVSAMGGNFFGTDIDGAFLAGDILLEARDTEGVLSRTLVAPGVSSFFGFVSTTSIVELKVTSVQGVVPRFLWPTVDNLRLAQRNTPSLPEPGTVALAALALLAMAGATRRLA